MLRESHLELKHRYVGKVRDCYRLPDDHLFVAVSTDRISCFDKVYEEVIPYKGQVLNELTEYFFQQTSDICPNWLLKTCHPNVSVGLLCEPIPIEFIIRGYMVGSMWRKYRQGQRNFHNIIMPDKLKEYDELPFPLITPTTKEYKQGCHDQPISVTSMMEQNIITQKEWKVIQQYVHLLFQRGQTLAKAKGLVLADCKLEFGRHPKSHAIVLIDELFTPDSCRYYRIDRDDEETKWVDCSKECVRKWIVAHDFPSHLSDKIVEDTSTMYCSLYSQLTGLPFVKNNCFQDMNTNAKVCVRRLKQL